VLVSDTHPKTVQRGSLTRGLGCKYVRPAKRSASCERISDRRGVADDSVVGVSSVGLGMPFESPRARLSRPPSSAGDRRLKDEAVVASGLPIRWATGRISNLWPTKIAAGRALPSFAVRVDDGRG
jgi:hypothetical protein